MRSYLSGFTVLSLLVSPSILPAQVVGSEQSATERSQPTPVSSPAFDNGFDEWVRGVMEDWNVPGIAVAALKDGEVVLSKGYGYRDRETQAAVTPSTLFAIGSNSKSFTVVLMGQLVDEGKLEWDKPVREYLPDFQLWDDYATRKMRVKDLVTHVSGLPRHDALWYGRSYDREELFGKLRYLEPTTSFRGRWQYQNLMFMTAGYLVEQVTGRPWDALVRERIFQPLGMDRSNTSADAMPGSGDYSYPYVLRDDELTKVPFRNIDNVGPAGSINSSVDEMVRYIQMRMNLGELDGHRLLSQTNDSLMQEPQSVVGAAMGDPELGPMTYGMGLTVSSYRGHKWVQHGGGIDGFISQMAWLPNDGIGVMVLSNMSGAANPVPMIVLRRVFDDLLEYEPIDWNARTRELVDQGLAREEEQRKKREEARIEGTTPTHDLSAYAGVYTHPAYGTIEVSVQEGRLQVGFDQFRMALEHHHYDVFSIDAGRATVPLTGLVVFHTNKQDGSIESLGVPLEPSLDDIVFTRAETP